MVKSGLGKSTRKVSLYNRTTALILLLLLNQNRFYIRNNPVVILSKPSVRLQQTLETTEKDRVKDQRERLGSAGLEVLKKVLEDAKAEHDRPIPPQVLTTFPVPNVNSISWIPVDSARNESGEITTRSKLPSTISTSVEEHLNKDNASIPYFIQFDHVNVCHMPYLSCPMTLTMASITQSEFITISAYMSTAKIPAPLKP